jgi:hypothetical protein
MQETAESPLFRGRPVIRRRAAPDILFGWSLWRYLLLLSAFSVLVICILAAFQDWKAAWQAFASSGILSAICYWFVRPVYSIHFDGASKSMTARWFLGYKKPRRRALEDLQAIQLVSSGGVLFSLHSVSLIFESSSTSDVLVIRIMNARTAKRAAQILAECFGVPLLEKPHEPHPGAPDSMPKVLPELSCILGLIVGVIGAVLSQRLVDQMEPGFLKALPGIGLFAICFFLGFLVGCMGVWLLWFGFFLYWSAVKAIVRAFRKTETERGSGSFPRPGNTTGK